MGTRGRLHADALVIGKSISIPLSEVLIRNSTSSGPGGQHANRSYTKVTASFNVEDSQSLSEAQKVQIIQKLGNLVQTTSSNSRSQTRNRVDALARLEQRLADALVQAKPRRPSKKTRSSHERRLIGKRIRSNIKSNRRISTDE